MRPSALLVLLTGALAARFTHKRRQARLSQPSIAADSSSSSSSSSAQATAANDTSTHQYSSNWAGAVLVGTGFRAVTGTFVVPTPQRPTSGSSAVATYAASAWVGIDGDTASKSILQTGVDFYIEGGSVSYNAWFEWYPQYATDFTGISIHAGDTIRLTVNATTNSSGTALVENLSAGTWVTHTFAAGQTPALQRLNAEWIVEDFQLDGSLVPMANFSTVTFTDASVDADGGAVLDPSSSRSGSADSQLVIMDIRQGNKTFTNASVVGESVVVGYV